MTSATDAVDELESRGLRVVNDHVPEWSLIVEAESRTEIENTIELEYHITDAVETADGAPYFYGLELL